MKPILLLSTLGKRKTTISVETPTSWQDLVYQIESDLGVDLSKMQVTALSKGTMNEFVITKNTVVSNDTVAVISLSPVNVKNRISVDITSRKSMINWIKENTPKGFLKNNHPEYKSYDKNQLFTVFVEVLTSNSVKSTDNRSDNSFLSRTISEIEESLKEIKQRVVILESFVGIVNTDNREEITEKLFSYYSKTHGSTLENLIEAARLEQEKYDSEQEEHVTDDDTFDGDYASL